MPVQICPALIDDTLEATAVVPKYDMAFALDVDPPQTDLT
jgi:hypothetical protein